MRLQCQPKTKPSIMAQASSHRRFVKALRSAARHVIKDATTAKIVLQWPQATALCHFMSAEGRCHVIRKDLWRKAV